MIARKLPDNILQAAARAARIPASQLDPLTDSICSPGMGGFAGLIDTSEDYHPTLRVDIDPRCAQLAAAFNKAAELLGQSRRAWTPAYSEEQEAILAEYGLANGFPANAEVQA